MHYVAEGSLRPEEQFTVDLSEEFYADGSRIEDRPTLVIVTQLVTSDNIDALEAEADFKIQPEQGEFLIRDAGLGRGSFNGEPAYSLYLYLNGEVDAQDAQIDERDLYHVLIHEWTHLRDRPFRRDPEWSDIDVYRNLKHEVTAYLQQIMHDVTTHRQVYLDEYQSKANGIVEFLNAHSPEWQEIENSLSRKNRNRILSAVYTALHYKPNPASEVAAVRGYLVNPHADPDEQFEWYHRSSDDHLEFDRMEDSQSKFPAFYLSSTASSVIDLGGSYNDTIYVINIKDGKYLDITNVSKGELAQIRSCLVRTLEDRDIPPQDATYLADYQIRMFKKSEMWYWMESVPVPSAEVEMTTDYMSIISTIKGSKVKVPGSKRTYIFYRGYPNWNYPAVFIDCLKRLGYDGWFETQDNTALPQITVALLNPMDKAERNFDYPLYYAESLVERGELP
jgi:hypothetical protein